MLRKFLKNKSGATAIEYSLIAALLSVLVIPAMGSLGDAVQAQFTFVDSTLSEAADFGNGSGNNGQGSGNGGSN